MLINIVLTLLKQSVKIYLLGYKNCVIKTCFPRKKESNNMKATTWWLKKSQSNDKLFWKLMSYSYHIEQKTFIEASCTNKMHTAPPFENSKLNERPGRSHSSKYGVWSNCGSREAFISQRIRYLSEIRPGFHLWSAKCHDLIGFSQAGPTRSKEITETNPIL